MDFPTPLIPCILLRRYKRFLADVRFASGEETTVHCPNPGAMLGCAGKGWQARVSESFNPKRKLRFTLEMVHDGRGWIGVNPGLANAVAEEGLRAGAVPKLAGYPLIRREARFGEATRFDFLLSRGSERCYVEVKSVTLVGVDGLSAFPDAATARGLRHLRELGAARKLGFRTVLLFVVQRGDGLKGFRCAHEIDPAYASAFVEEVRDGLEVFAHWAEVGPRGIRLTEVLLPLLTSVDTPARLSMKPTEVGAIDTFKILLPLTRLESD
jgi:sugar fermentation stimulation protein A